MTHASGVALTAALLSALAAAPAAAQHMNAPDSPCRNIAQTAAAAACFAKARTSADAELNRTYAEVLHALSPADRTKLRSGERLWLAARNATCAAERDLYDGGSGGPPAQLACLAAETRARTADLRTAYGWKLQKAGR